MPQKNKKLQMARFQQKWSQAEAAKKIEVDQKTYIRWEQGLHYPQAKTLAAACEVFGMSARELGFDDDAPGRVDNGREMLSVEIPIAPVYDPLLPEALTGANGLIGRDSLLKQLKKRIFASKRSALIALHGLPGIGKTALAAALTSDPEIRSHFRDGILWGGVGTHPNVLDSLSRWGTLLEISATAQENPNSQEAGGKTLRTAIGKRRLLLVIDDAWDAQVAGLVGPTVFIC